VKVTCHNAHIPADIVTIILHIVMAKRCTKKPANVALLQLPNKQLFSLTVKLQIIVDREINSWRTSYVSQHHRPAVAQNRHLL